MSDRKMPLVGRIIIVAVVIIFCYAGYYFISKPAARKDPGDKSSSANSWSGGSVEINIAYGSEKKSWLEWALQEFNKTTDGQKIKVNLMAMGSQEAAQATLASDKKIHVWSPASALYKETFIQDWQVKYGNNPILKEENLALTPMCFVIWNERYQQFQKKYQHLNFTTIARALGERGGWDAIAKKPEWGLFKLGHTNPGQSNSGLMTLVLLAYNYQSKTKDLEMKDILATDFQNWMQTLEHGVSGLSNSTGTLMKEMVLKGPSSFDAVFVYESVAIDYLKSAEGRWGELHIVYPQENMWSDNPYYIIDASWSSSDQRGAAEQFLKFLMSEPIQRESLKHGFRPGDPKIGIKAADSPFMIYQQYGLQLEPGSTCEAPKAELINNLLASWQRGQGRR